jgi:hypothetical protein
MPVDRGICFKMFRRRKWRSGDQYSTTLSRITPQCQRIKTSRRMQSAPLYAPQQVLTDHTAHSYLTVTSIAIRTSRDNNLESSLYFVFSQILPSNTTSAFNGRITPLGVVGLSRSTVILLCNRKVPSSILGAETTFLCPVYPVGLAGLSFWGEL